jgi:glutamine cyclotransferase
MNDGTARSKSEVETEPAEIVREYGPYPGVDHVHGVSFDGKLVWCATGKVLRAFDPSTGQQVRSLDVACDAGTAFDGRHLYQLAAGRIHKIDPDSGHVLSSFDAPGGHGEAAGLTWAEGKLWVAQHRNRAIIQIDAESGAILRTIECDRFVTGVTFADGELWHATWEGDESELRQIDAHSGRVRVRVRMPEGVHVTGLESDGGELLFCGGGATGRLRAVRKPKRRA